MQLIDANTEVTEMLELFEKDFKLAGIKCFSTNENEVECQQRNRRYKVEQSRNFRTENTVIEI